MERKRSRLRYELNPKEAHAVNQIIANCRAEGVEITSLQALRCLVTFGIDSQKAGGRPKRNGNRDVSIEVA